MKLYLAVTNDKYELPLAVAETQKELAAMLGVGGEYISRYMDEPRKLAKILFKKVEVDE